MDKLELSGAGEGCDTSALLKRREVKQGAKVNQLKA